MFCFLSADMLMVSVSLETRGETRCPGGVSIPAMSAHSHRRPRRSPGGNNHLIEAKVKVFSSPEPKAQVSYCHSAPSVVRPSGVRRPSVVRPSVNFHIFNFFSGTAWWILMKLGRDEVLMVSYKCCCFLARSAMGRIQGGAKIGH